MSKIYQVRGIIDPNAGCCTKFEDIGTWYAEFADKAEADECCKFVNDMYFNKYRSWCEFEVVEIDTDNLDSFAKIKQDMLNNYKLMMREN